MAEKGSPTRGEGETHMDDRCYSPLYIYRAGSVAINPIMEANTFCVNYTLYEVASRNNIMVAKMQDTGLLPHLSVYVA